jgi:hypothetical protein
MLPIFHPYLTSISIPTYDVAIGNPVGNLSWITIYGKGVSDTPPDALSSHPYSSFPVGLSR